MSHFGPTTPPLLSEPTETIRRAMELALSEARTALRAGDVPVGAVAVELTSGRVLGFRHNEKEAKGDPTAHAELLVLVDAARAVGSWRLDGVGLVVTLEPCPMCAGALVGARIGSLTYGASDPKAGACGSLYNLAADPRLNHEFPVTRGFMADEASALLTDFFAARR